MKTRGFEIVSRYQEAGLTLPKRQTKQAAGYDLQAAVDMVVPTIWKQPLAKMLWAYCQKRPQQGRWAHWAEQVLKPVLIPTGLKAYLPAEEVLLLVNRSSGPLKRGLVLPNSVGVIDADYYDNPQNEGEIFVQMLNFFPTDRLIKKGDRICQGIFVPYLTVDNDHNDAPRRQGGFGSSGE
ncbi:dUTP diphosphatase [Lactobacillus sp. DCY120]|uniref:dUTP diphosphatase n=1 Tax=Bombilactobacillus apium TaxID=2675299 RepID=A0A850R624_9LACO|nr:dUTP diphosphatase [Bombilactobacillus apium]NVY95995.1 dUTP diphosphatase [Bombilactobacillus apium]